ncbi:glycine cleavage system protein R [Vibrio aphrogenes]|uniref:glycine cleavage system protein R n=1 Tax=Vibrio aphrogenes TaxID=1891186 RepID=UPI000B354C49|nr:ACT domain-containing protein [Vibrio aphrogenes]
MTNQTLFIANISGQASPKTIQQLAKVTHENNGSWITSKINYLDDQLAGLIKIACPETKVEIIQSAFNQAEGLTCQFAQSQANKHAEDDIYQLRLDSQERSGIIQEISHILERERANILSIETQRLFLAGRQGINTNLFTSQFRITLPEQTNIKDIIAELEAITQGIQVIDLSATLKQ